MKYAAIVSVPGYLPDSDEPPPLFDEAWQAWQCLYNERRAEIEQTFGRDDETVEELNRVCRFSLTLERPVTGTVVGPTPGYEGDHDLGVAYQVVEVEDPCRYEHDGFDFDGTPWSRCATHDDLQMGRADEVWHQCSKATS